MIRRLIALFAVASFGIPQAAAIEVRYNNSVVLNTSYPTAQYSSTYAPYTYRAVPATSYCVPSPQLENSIFNPGGPLLTPILNNWLYWGNAFNWTGNNCRGLSSYGSVYYPTSYATSLSTGNSWNANYASTSTVANQWNANYSPTVVTKNWNANYSPTVVTKNWNANYSPTVVTKNWNANYSPTVVEKNWDANYTPTEVSKNWNANYSAAPATERDWTANYSPTVVEKNWDANYSPTVVSKNGVANYSPASTSSNRIVYPTDGSSAGSAYSQVYAPYTTAQSYSGAAFGSLFGDGRDAAFGGSATESFVARLRGQTSPSYTSRAEALESQNLASFFDVNPVVAYTPVTAYDRSFTTSPSANLNATPVTGPATTSQAAQDEARNMNLAVPLQQSSTYTQDLQVLESRGIVPGSWKNRGGQTQLTRADVASMLVLLRNWRDTGGLSTKYNKLTTLLPVITDMKPSNVGYFDFVVVANERILYMPEMRENKGVIVSAKAEPTAKATRAQTLQAVMTALYLRPNTQYSIAGYSDLTAQLWYTQWALTARAYGLDYGKRFNAEQTLTQEEAVHMVATLLKQIR